MIPSTSLIPIHDENPTQRFSVLSVVIIVMNVAAFLVTPQLGMGDSPQLLEFFYKWGLVPWEVTHGQPVTQEVLQTAGIGAQCTGPCIPEKNILLSFLTSIFLHGGILHIGGNMLFLWVFGNNIEDTLGTIRFPIFYLLTGFAASMAHVLINPDSVIPTVGASGAISGLLGAYIVLFPRAHVLSIVPLFFYITTVRLPAFVVLGIWFVSQFFIGTGQQAGGGVAWMAHVGGFVAGAVLIWIFAIGRPRRRPPAYVWG